MDSTKSSDEGSPQHHGPGDTAASGLASTGFLTGRKVLVTGAASGIGRACADGFAAAGAEVYVVDRAGEAAKEVAEAIGGTAVVADLSEAEAVDALPDDADIVVNNAGLQHVAPLHEFPPERFALIQRVMVEAPFRILRRTLPHMYARGWGRVVNISSVHGLRASAYKSAYVTAKHALEGLSKVVALEGAPHGVTSNCISPGYVRTPLVEEQIAQQALAHGIPAADVVDQVFLDRTAIKRLIEPPEVAEAALWLCTERSAYITGTSIPLDGGWTAH
ncbi:MULTISPECIES: 3-hydroxybutyrate dehydrogenase [unclassified Streptomyces]|uniref:3-hydroxybutyrate dehydrogenase n=1 Tax=unclassified Streptomyces TaxID=2593676 RepID=UPI00225A9A6F|nr:MULTISPECIES: 3-hydroxybutyrate dehydrogenase [unclassified Streptomyces]MCX4913208.1 3-hydroxybutyrate dehydrogenase [Streptomyces sp. NBC_00687]MCX5137517.1 3-hydroxybutyrate dehydrogenase [Streptomyces sp. NBC_00340]WSK64692.1 3-hydroxybutyrate dehydrogenase [Streptomyces sp. NBC_01281]